VERIEVLQRLEREVSVLMRRSRRVIAERAHLVHPELSPPGYLLLMFLHSQGECRAADLADALSLDKGAVSRSVHQLVDLGLVVKEADPVDRRAVRLQVTEAAAETMRRISRARLEALDARLGEWSQEEIESFVDTFASYNELLEVYHPGHA